MKQHEQLRVLVYGATGSQAWPIIPELQNRGHQPVAVTQSSIKAKAFTDKQIETVIAGMQDAQRLNKITQGIDVVSLLVPFFLPNPEDGLRYAQHAIDAAKNNRVRLIVWNASGSIPDQPTGNPAIDIRTGIARYLRQSGVPYVIFQPGVYAENLLGPWTAPFVIRDNTVRYPLPEDAIMGWLPTQDLAKLIVASMENESLAGSSFRVSGSQGLNGQSLARAFSEGLQRPITYKAMEPKEFGEILDKTFGPGAGDKAAIEYQRMWEKNDFPQTYFNMSDVLERLPVRMTAIRDWVSLHADRFT